MVSFENKIIIITGASEGIGCEMALQLSKQNCRLVLASRSFDKLENLAQIIRKNGSEALPIKCDITIDTDCKKLIEKTIEHFGGIDILINNAGATSRALIENTDIEVLKTLMEINYWGAVRLTKATLPQIRKNKGMLIAISSVIGKVPVPGRSGYAAAKHALEAYYETLRMELQDEDVDVLVIRPSYTKTNTRINALTADGTKQNYSTLDEEKLLSPEIAATKILNAIRNKKNGFTLGKKMEGSLLIRLYQLMPEFISRMIVKKIKKEPRSLFLKTETPEKNSE